MVELNFPNAVREEKDCYGRRAELERIEHILLSGTRRPVAIYGERRIGKTSIVNVVTARLRARAAPQIVPLFPATVGVYALEDFARELLQSLCEFRGTSLAEIGLVGGDRRFALSSMGQFFDETRRLLQGSPATLHVLCIDEFDALLHNCLTYGQAAEKKKVLDLASDLIGLADLPLTFLLTLTDLSGIVQDPFNTLIDEAERVTLNPLSEADTYQLLDGVLGGQVVLETAQRRQLFRLSGGHPYILKLILSSLIDPAADGAPPLRVDAAALERAAVAAAIDPHAEHVLGNILRVHFSAEERELVTLMAGMDDHITLEQIERAGGEWRPAAENLVRRSYLARESASRAYVFRFAFLGRWLRQQPTFERDLDRVGELRQRLIIEIVIDGERRRVLARGAEVQLTAQEYQALSYLCQHVDRLISRDQLADHLWPGSAIDINDAAISTLISRLRHKLGDSARQPRYLETIPGQGVILRRATFV